MQKWLFIDAVAENGQKLSVYLPDGYVLDFVIAAAEALKGTHNQLQLKDLSVDPEKPLELAEFNDWIRIWVLLNKLKDSDEVTGHLLYFRIGGHLIVKRRQYLKAKGLASEVFSQQSAAAMEQAIKEDKYYAAVAKIKGNDRVLQLKVAKTALEWAQVEQQEQTKSSSGAKSGSKKKQESKDEFPEAPKEVTKSRWWKLYSSLNIGQLKRELDLLKADLPPEHGGDGFYMADADLSGMELGMWARYDGPSYRDYRNYLEVILDTAEKKLTGKFLQDYQSLLYKPKSKLGSDILPVLAATMFIAEPARQPRSFIIGLLTLDLIGRKFGQKKKELSVVRLFPVSFDDTKAKYPPARAGSASATDPVLDETGLLKSTINCREASLLIHWLSLRLKGSVPGWKSCVVTAGSAKYFPDMGELQKSRSDLRKVDTDLARQLLGAINTQIKSALAERLAAL
jgi:hypothetical protein